jgi:hypothetical protein
MEHCLCQGQFSADLILLYFTAGWPLPFTTFMEDGETGTTLMRRHPAMSSS